MLGTCISRFAHMAVVGTLPVVRGLALVLAPLRVFAPGSSWPEDRLKIAFLSLVATTFFLYVSPYYSPGANFTTYAEVLIRGGSDPRLASRDAGYPILLVLSGYPFTGSFIGISLINAAFAFLMPLLVQDGFGEPMRRTGFYAAIVMIVSCIPYLFLKVIFHDHAFVFFSVLTVTYGMRYIRTIRPADLYGTTLASLAASFTRPAGNLFFLVVLALLFLAAPGRRRIASFAVCIAIFAAGIGLYSLHRSYVLRGETGVSEISYSGRQIYYNLYINSRYFDIRIDRSLGPANARIIDSLEEGLKDHERGREPPRLAEWFKENGAPAAFVEKQFRVFDKAGLIENMFRFPSHDYFEVLCLFEPNDRVFFRASLEIMQRYPLYLIRYTLRNFGLFMWTPGYAHTRFNADYIGQHREGSYFQPFHGAVTSEEGLSDRGLRELKHDPLKQELKFVQGFADGLERYWRTYYTPAVQVLVVLMVIGAVGSFFAHRAAGLSFWMSAAFLAYNAAITCAFAEPNYRYHFFIVPFLIICAAVGARSLALLIGLGLQRAGLLKRTTESVALAPARNLRPWRVALAALCALSAGGWIMFVQHAVG
jgi:hypothetical protein